jgi:5,10-methylenetetrahydromethanopterin reductase
MAETPPRWPSALGVSLEGREPLAEIPALARAAEAGGAGTLWVASHLFLRDPVILALTALQATTRLRVALMAMSPYAMHPVHMAMAAAGLAELHPGRVILCLGAGAPADREAAGLDAPAPLATLREALLACRGLLAGEAVRLEGRVFRLPGLRALVGGAAAVPLLLAATRPAMLRLAGTHADGVILSGGSAPAYIRHCLDIVEEAAAGRPVARLSLVYTAPVAPGGARPAALAQIRRRLATVLRGAHHAGNLAAAGTVLDQARLMALTQAGDWPAGLALVDDQVIANHAAAGSPGELAAAIARFRAAGLDEVVLSGLPDPAAITTTLEALR